jgi:hypothetical protein
MTALPAAPLVRDAILAVLGKATSYRPDRSLRTKDCTAKVFLHFGLGERKTGSATDREEARIRKQWGTLKKLGLMQAGEPGAWTLTTSGVERARELNGFQYDPEDNLTTQFLDDKLKGGLWDSLASAVAAKFRVSATCNLVGDHVNTFLAKLIQRDGLRDRLVMGKPVYTSQLAAWCCRSAQNDIRAMGTNPVSRTVYGAQTITERRKGKRHGHTHATSAQIAAQTSEEGAGIVSFDIVDEAPNPEANLDQQQRVAALQAKLASCIRKARPGATSIDRDIEILDAMIAGNSVAEIATQYDLSPSRANTIVGGLRRTLRAALEAGALA